MCGWRTTCSLLQLISCHLKTVPHSWHPYHPHPQSASPFLSSAQSSSWRCWWLRTGSGSRRNANIFRKNELERPVLVFPSLVPPAGEGLGLGREGATSGTASISTIEGQRNPEPSNQKVGSVHTTQERRKKHWEKNSAYLRARPSWDFRLNMEVTLSLLAFLLQMWRGEGCTHSQWVKGRGTASPRGPLIPL